VAAALGKIAVTFNAKTQSCEAAKVLTSFADRREFWTAVAKRSGDTAFRRRIFV
jgi:hypothetical protein